MHSVLCFAFSLLFSFLFFTNKTLLHVPSALCPLGPRDASPFGRPRARAHAPAHASAAAQPDPATDPPAHAYAHAPPHQVPGPVPHPRAEPNTVPVGVARTRAVNGAAPLDIFFMASSCSAVPLLRSDRLAVLPSSRLPSAACCLLFAAAAAAAAASGATACCCFNKTKNIGADVASGPGAHAAARAAAGAAAHAAA